MSMPSSTTVSKVALGTGTLDKSSKTTHRLVLLCICLLAMAGWIYFLAKAVALIADKVL